MRQNNIIMWKYIKLLIIAPFVLIRHKRLIHRRNKAIERANKLSKKYQKNVFVFQIRRRFKVGTREELRRINKTGRKNLKHVHQSHIVDFDYRNSLIYTARHENGKEVKSTSV
jgi:hypothetical protein